MPDIQPNFIALAVAVALSFFLGFVWYTPMFGKIWLRELGLPPDHSTQGAALAKGLLANVTSCFLIALVLGNNITAWTPSTWGLEGVHVDPIGQAMQAAFFTWLGFFVPPLLNAMAWEKRSWRLSAVHAGYHLTSLAIAALAFAQWQRWKTSFPTQIVDMGDGLLPTGRTIKGQVITDGPTIESKEIVSGYSIVEAADYDAALVVAKACPVLYAPGASLEVRQLAGY